MESQVGRRQARLRWTAPPWVVLLATLVAVGCAGPPPGSMPVLRFIEDPAPPVFDVARLLGEKTVRSWHFSGSPPGRFQLREVSSTRGDGVGWWLMPAAQRVVLELEDAALVADEVETLRVVVEGRGLGGANLHWGPRGEPLVPERQLQLPFAGRTRETFDFRVGDHPAWAGEIGRLTLTLWTAADAEVGVMSMRAVRGVGPRHPPASVLEQPWRIELDAGDDFSDRRLALIGWPGYSHRRQLTVPDGARLRLGYGVWRSAREAVPETVRFRVVVEGGDGEVTLGEIEWRDRFRPGAPGSGGGFGEASFDLAPWAGQRVALRLEVEFEGDSGSGADPARALPLWANPEVTAPLARGEERPPDVVLIVADTLRADRLSLYGHGRETSPNLDVWAARHGAVFESVVSSAGWTLPAHTSLFTGLDAPRHGVNWPSSRVGDRLTLLAELLRGRGYATEAITGGGYLDPVYGLDRGFERYRTWPRGRASHEGEPPRTLGEAVETLRRRSDRPLFLFVHTYAVHAPYAPWQPHFGDFSPHPALSELRFRPPRPGDYRSRHTPELRRGGGESSTVSPSDLVGLVEDQYDAGVARLDGLLAPLLAASSSGRRLVILTSDHGEMLGERGLWDHGHIFEPTLKVPLIIAAPGGLGAGERFKSQVRSVDLMPTVLEWTGAPPGDDVDGRSLVPLLRGETVAESSPAWSYGRRVDEGLTVRLRDRLKLLLHDDVLVGRRNRVRAFEVGASPRDEREIDVDPSLLPLVDEIRTRLLRDLPGLHLRFSNDGPAPLRFEVSSGAAVPERVKVPDLRCGDCVRWKPPVGLDVEVPPGEIFTVILGDVRDARLQMTLQRPDGSRQRLTLDLTEHDRPLAMAVVDGSFQVTAGAPPPSGVGVHFHGAEGPVGDDPRLDAETAAALRALGYVE